MSSSFNPFSYEFHADPYPLYRWLRDEQPLYHDPELDVWVLSRYADVVEAHHDWQTFSSSEGPMIERVDASFFEVFPQLIAMDPPRHTRMRKLVNRVFTPRRVADLEPSIRQIAVGYLEPLVEAGGGDVVADFSALLPMDVIFTMLAVPEADRLWLREQIDTMLDRDPDSPDIPARSIEAVGAMTGYFEEMVRELRVSPRPGMVADLLEVEVETDDGDRVRLSDAEVVGFCGLLGSAGSETVARLLANALILLQRNPSVRATATAEPARIPDVVEESLRYWPPSQIQARTAMREVERHGGVIPERARVLLLTGAANRDEREYPDADTFDIDRPAHIALGFGHGIHVCLGAALARLESRLALEEFLGRCPRYAIDEDRCVRVHMTNVHGFASVPFSTR